MEQLSRSEEQVMAALWACSRAATRREIASHLPPECRWADSTLLNFLLRLEKKNFVRTEKQGNKNLYTPLVRRLTYCGAVIHPKHRILPLLRGHFCSRLPDESFLIYDAAHGTALLHRDGQVRYLAMERYIPGTDETELDWQRMWKRFFKALTIEQRRDEKAQMSHVPKRFWQDMCEMQPDLAFPAGAAVRKAD